MKLRALAGALLATALTGALTAGPAVARSSWRRPAHRYYPQYYLALGDSLSVGYQPNAQGFGVETDLGYTNDIERFYRREVRNLQLVEVGCPGDTTTSLLTGRGNDAAARYYRCDRRGGSQLQAAVDFLRFHHRPGEVPLVTIDIGANDVDGCADVPPAQIAGCVSAGEATIRKNTPKILAALRRAAPRGTRFAAMNLYDPVLGDYFSTNPTDRALATASISLLKGINADIQSADREEGFATAQVAAAFDTYNQTTMVSWEGQQIPVDVARVCAWTWACSTPPVGPNIHANLDGYQVIADTFEEVIGRLVG
jgi:lysophospholipase L1-like esterase